MEQALANKHAPGWGCSGAVGVSRSVLAAGAAYWPLGLHCGGEAWEQAQQC